MNIFDLIAAPELASYWELLTKDRAPFLGETLFPADKKLGLDLKWIKGSNGAPVVLKLSAFDVAAVPRDRIGFDKLSAEMPFFKESLYIDETLRQELNKVKESGNQVLIDAIIGQIFNDQKKLIEGAAAQRERMRMMALTTGAISLTSNGQSVTYDYGLPADHKVTTSTSWSNVAADIIGDIRAGQEKIEGDTGEKPTRAICSMKTWQDILKNEAIKKSIFVLSNGQASLSTPKLKEYLMQELELEVVVYNKMYKNESGVNTKYVPDDTFVIFPAGSLGTTWFGTTPEESDLMTSPDIANVAIVDTGVAVTTIKKADPVNVETKVSMITLPSFEMADQVYILDTTV